MLSMPDSMSHSQRISMSLAIGTAYRYNRIPHSGEIKSFDHAISNGINNTETFQVIQKVLNGLLVPYWAEDKWEFVETDSDFDKWSNETDFSQLSTPDKLIEKKKIENSLQDDPYDEHGE